MIPPGNVKDSDIFEQLIRISAMKGKDFES